MRIVNKNIVMGIKDFKHEHIRLVKVLNSVSNERNKQQKELIELSKKLKRRFK